VNMSLRPDTIEHFGVAYYGVVKSARRRCFYMHTLGTGKGIDGIAPRKLAGSVLLLTKPNIEAFMILGEMMMLEAVNSPTP